MVSILRSSTIKGIWRKFSIDVTEDDIGRGLRNVASYCPVARSLRRSGMTRINVYATYLSFLDPKNNFFYFCKPLPATMTNFIISFDKKTIVSPLRLTVDCLGMENVEEKEASKKSF